MTDREAARIMPYLVDRCHSVAEKVAVMRAKVAHQEREERSKGCKHCEGLVEINLYRYCPMCGRPLKQEG